MNLHKLLVETHLYGLLEHTPKYISSDWAASVFVGELWIHHTPSESYIAMSGLPRGRFSLSFYNAKAEIGERFGKSLEEFQITALFIEES